MECNDNTLQFSAAIYIVSVQKLNRNHSILEELGVLVCACLYCVPVPYEVEILCSVEGGAPLSRCAQLGFQNRLIEQSRITRVVCGTD